MSEQPVDILLVDDKPVKLLALEAALAPLGERLHKAASGREALRLLLGHDFAVVVLDVSMPTMDGFETAELIRGRQRSAHTPVIFISAVNQTEADASRGYRLGAVDYVYAPFAPEVVRAKVSVFVELHRKTLEARRQADQIAADALERAATGERLRHAERLASLGTLCAGLGHDMANLLLPVRFHLESIAAQDVPPLVLEDAAAVLRCTEYLQRLAHGLRMLSLDGEDDRASTSEIDLQQWWMSIAPILRGCLPRGTVLEAQWDPPRSRVRIPEHHLSQAVFNLVQNAGDALRHQESRRVRVWTLPAGAAAVRLGITDNGPGMPDDVRNRCFDPFFTTKTRGISTGLGLSLVRTLVAKAGGTVHVESRNGAGTTFVLTLPCDRQGSVAPGFPAATDRPRALISVAEPRIAGYVAAVLGSLGYDPRIGSGEESPATRLWVVESEQARAEALARFCEGDPSRRVVVVGGWKDRPTSGHVLVTGERSSPAAIRRALRRAVEVLHAETEGQPDATADPGLMCGRQRDDCRGDSAQAAAGAGL